MVLNAIIEKDKFGYFAYVPSLEGCISQGDTFEEALKNIKEAISLYIESLEADTIKEIISKNSVIVPLQVNINA